MADAIGIGLLGAGWITRAHGHALYTLNHVTPLARLCDAIVASAAEGRRVRLDELTSTPATV